MTLQSDVKYVCLFIVEILQLKYNQIKIDFFMKRQLFIKNEYEICKCRKLIVSQAFNESVQLFMHNVQLKQAQLANQKYPFRFI